MCFTNRRLPQKLQFTYSNSEIEIVKELNYFGILLTKWETLKGQIKHWLEKGPKQCTTF